MRKFIVQLFSFFIAIALIVTLCPEKAFAESADEPSSWAVQQISILRMLNFGDPNIYSSYRQNITREEFCMLVSSLYEQVTGKKIDAGGINPFTDISQSPYSNEILKAYSLKIVNGTGKGLFNPKGLITRQEVAVMIFNAIKAIHPGAELIINQNIIFNDDEQIASWAKPAVTYLYDNYILSGIKKQTVGPLLNTTREQALVLMMKAGVLTGFLNEEISRNLKAGEISKDDDGIIEDLQTDSAQAYWELGRKYTLENKDQKMPRKGVAAYNKAIELDAGFYLAYRDKAEALFMLGMYDEALVSAEKALELNNSDGWCYVHPGRIYAVKKENGKAIADFTKAIQLLISEDANNPDIAGVYLSRAQVYLQEAKIKEAVSDLKHASEMDPMVKMIMSLIGIG